MTSHDSLYTRNSIIQYKKEKKDSETKLFPHLCLI